MKYDIIVIGAGSGGLNIAGFMNTAGFKVLLIDKSDANIGGDCLNFGCVPSKALLHAAKLVQQSREAQQFGVRHAGKVDMQAVHDYVKAKQEVIREHENATYFRKKGMDVELGTAVFVGKNAVRVNNKTHTAKRIVLATGSRPRIPDIKGLENVKYFTNETIFSLTTLPKKLLVVGGGPIGVELGQAFQRLGSEVTVIQKGPHFLPKEEPQMSEVLHQQLEKEGMRFFFNTTPKIFHSSNELIVEHQNAKQSKLSFDAVLITAGRVLNIEGLDLEKAGIEVKNNRIVVDEYLRTTNKNVLLCGDVAGSYQFTHAAELHAGVILSNFFSPFKKKLSNDHLSWVTYTSPEIATFGLHEKELQARKIPYEVLELAFNDSDRHIVDEATQGRMKWFVHKDKILGGTMVAENAGELFQELVLANSVGIPMKQLFSKIYAYPTASRVNKAMISSHYKKKLTPFSKKLLKWLY